MTTQLPPLTKAAILLMSLPEDDAAALMGKLSPRQIESVSIEIANLSQINAVEQMLVINEFAATDPNSLGGDQGGLEVAKLLVKKALGGDTANTLDNVQQSIEALPFGFLKKVDSQNLITFLIDEHPQTIALIMSHLPPTYGAEILSGLTEDRQLQVIRRVANMGQTNPEVIKQVEAGLASRMENVMSQSFENAGGVPSVAEMLNVSDRSTERTLMERLGEDDPDLVDNIRRLMFVFDDITKLGEKDVQTILKNVESAQWAMALKGASGELKEKVLGNMSKRAAAMLEEEMDYLGAVRVSEVESVQQQIVDTIRRLEDAGEISTHADETDEEFIQ